MKRFFKTAFVLAMSFTALAFAGCSDDEKNLPEKDLTVDNLSGNYVGTFNFDGSDMEGNPVKKQDLPISLNVEKNKVIFPEFPISAILSALVGEEAGAGLAGMIGKLSYTVEMVDPVADAQSLSSTLKTPRLRIVVASEGVTIMVVLIDLESPGKMVYTASNKTLTFVLKTTKFGYEEAGVDNPEMFPLLNTLTFKVVKK
ncbi:MAG: hypothetical protein RR960_05150 [Alistipes sp.]